jgi:hypothetical protein
VPLPLHAVLFVSVCVCHVMRVLASAQPHGLLAQQREWSEVCCCHCKHAVFLCVCISPRYVHLPRMCLEHMRVLASAQPHGLLAQQREWNEVCLSSLPLVSASRLCLCFGRCLCLNMRVLASEQPHGLLTQQRKWSEVCHCHRKRVVSQASMVVGSLTDYLKHFTSLLL